MIYQEFCFHFQKINPTIQSNENPGDEEIERMVKNIETAKFQAL